MNFTFTNQMEENTGLTLSYPFHLNRDKLQEYMHPSMPCAQAARSFEQVLKKAYREPFAFYLTDEDKRAYSEQEINLLLKTVEMEQKRINDGMCIIDLNLDAETLAYIMIYKRKHNFTFEEAVIDILSKLLASPESEKVTESNYHERI